MAIKIIKEGIKEFYATCPFCDCEFSYEKEDLYNGIIICPCCGATLEAKANTKKMVSEPIRDNMVWETPEYKELQRAFERQAKKRSFIPCDNKINPCLSCPFYISYLSKGQPYIGDSPCQWCQKNPWKVTCTSNVKQGE